MATSSVTELVQAGKRPRARSESTNRPFMRNSKGGEQETFESSTGIRRSSKNKAPPRRHSVVGTRTSMQKINEFPENKPKKPARRSFVAKS